MIDIHSHLLSQLDDGAGSIEETKDMLNMYITEGITTIVATPHYIYGDDKYNNEYLVIEFNKVKQIIEDDALPLTLLLGNECFLDENIVQALHESKCYTINHTKYVLVEIYNRASTTQIENLIYKLMLRSYNPIIAHPERLYERKDAFSIINKLVDKGCYMQVNVRTLTRKKYNKERKLVYKMFKHQLVHFVATDAHNNSNRKPELSEGYSIVAKKFGQDVADNVFIYNQEKVINDITISLI